MSTQAMTAAGNRLITDDRNIPGEGEGGLAWHNALPAWITTDPAYQRLRQGPKHTMQTIADKCDQPPQAKTGEIIGSLALLVCFGGHKLRNDCGCGSRTLWRHLCTLIELGYVVPLSYGTGRLANIYGVPGRRGELDGFRARRGERCGSGPGGRWDKEDTSKLLRLLCQNDTLARGDPTKPEAGQNGTPAVSKRHTSHVKMTRQAGQNDALPSPSSSCSASSLDHPLLGGEKRAPPHDDDRGRSLDPNPGPLVDQLSITLPDGAGPDQVKAELREHGVDAGRAHKLALHPLTTPAMVRDVIARADGYRKANPGAYIGTMLDDAIVTARDAERERNAQAVEASQQRVADAEASIDTMPDAELEEAIESIGPLKGLSPAAVRGDCAFRRELARHLSLHEVTVP